MDRIDHLPAALALRQRPPVPGPRSTVGTQSEVLNVLRLMASRLGTHLCPNGHSVAPSVETLREEIVCPVCGIAQPPRLPEPLVVKRRVSACGAIMVGGQKVQVGLAHARKMAEVTVEADTCQVTVDSGITITAPRTTSRDIRRHKASNYDLGNYRQRVPACRWLARLNHQTGDPRYDLHRDVLISCPLAGRP